MTTEKTKSAIELAREIVKLEESLVAARERVTALETTRDEAIQHVVLLETRLSVARHTYMLAVSKG